MPDADHPPAPSSPGTAREVFGAFLRLGLTAFGGPIAHLGYLRETFVRRRGWLDEAQFAQLLAVCQFLPGPASSQLGFGIGLLRAGWGGALAAFVGFTLPSALLMLGFAALAPRLAYGPGAAAVHGLKLVAVAVVAHGLLGMLRSLAPDLPRRLIALGAALLVGLTGNAWLQLVAIALGAVSGLWVCRQARASTSAPFPVAYGRGVGAACIGVFGLFLLIALLLPAGATPTLAGVAAAFYRAGALVFGGGHVVLPLLQQSVVAPGWVSPDGFLAGYGAAQAVPGPMFTLAAYLGAVIPLGLPPVVGALVALLAVFLPGFLLLAAMLPLWGGLVRHPRAASAMAGINAAVVGLLGAAFIDPVWTSGVRAPVDLGIAAVGFALLAWRRWPAWTVVPWCVGAAMGAARLGLAA